MNKFIFYLLLLTVSTQGICANAANDDSLDRWDVFSASFSREEIQEWKDSSDTVKETRREWEGHGYDFECVYCCLFNGNYKSVYTTSEKLRSHCNSKLHKETVEEIQSSPIAMHFYTFLVKAESLSKQETLAEIIGASRPVRKKAIGIK